MDNDRNIIYNHKQIINFILLAIILIFIIISIFIINYIYLWFIIILLLNIVLISISPLYCVVDKEGIKIIYMFGLKLSATWKEIRKISTIYINKLGYYYYFEGIKGKKAFFMRGEFPKSKKLKMLILQYANDKYEE